MSGVSIFPFEWLRQLRTFRVGAVVLMFLAAVGCLAGGIVHQRAATRLIGEGELFQNDANRAASIVMDAQAEGGSLDDSLRHVRNVLAIEAVSLIEPDGSVVSSTAAAFRGTRLPAGMVVASLERDRFVALAAPVPVSLSIDGVVEWQAEDVLYQVLLPIDEPRRGLLLYYDLAELVVRRGQAQGMQTGTLQWIGVSVLFLLGGLAVMWIDARRRVAEERRRANSALAIAEERNRVRNEFLVMINHEIRTPLTSVVVGAELLFAEDDLSVDQRKALLGDMIAEGRYLNDLIAQILEVARIENQGLECDLRSTPVGEVLRETGRISPKLLIVDVEKSFGDSAISTAQKELAQLLASLAGNSMAHGATEVQLDVVDTLPFAPQAVVGHAGDDQLFFLVIDDGPGIAVDFLPRAFEKFEKNDQLGSTGLGLYRAKLTVDALGGCIAVRTGPSGTTMAVGIPTSRANAVTRASVPS